MTIQKNNNAVHGYLELNGKIVRNQRCIKILGTLLSVDMKYDNNFTVGINNMKTQLKRRASAIKRISKLFPLKFNILLVNSLLLGKICYNLPIWDNMSANNNNIVNNIIIKTVRHITKKNYLGKLINGYLRNVIFHIIMNL